MWLFTLWGLVGLPFVALVLVLRHARLLADPRVVKPSAEHMRGKVCVVTGSNTGIGFRTAAQLAAMGATVVLACRDQKKARAAAEAIHQELAQSGDGASGGAAYPMELDLADLASVSRFASDLCARYSELDVLVCNAGLNTSRPRTRQGHEASFGVGYLGHYALVRALLPLLQASPGTRVVMLASVMHWFGQDGALANWDHALSGRYPWSCHLKGTASAYCDKNAANILLAAALRVRGVTAFAVNPGTTSSRDSSEVRCREGGACACWARNELRPHVARMLRVHL